MEDYEYRKWAEIIDTANNLSNEDNAKEVLRKIQLQLYSRYGTDNDDVENLINRFAYYI